MNPQASVTEGDDAVNRDGVEAQNAAACATPLLTRADRRPLRSDDVKRSDAASLAQELATSSPWSEAFMPTRPLRTHPTTDRQETTNMYPLEPPPAYSNLPQVYELPAEPVSNTIHAEDPPSSESTAHTTSAIPVTSDVPSQAIHSRPHTPSSVRQETLEELEQTVETPLLSDVVRQAVQPVRTYWERRKKAKRRRQIRRRFCCSCILMIVLGFLLVFFLCGGFAKGKPLFGHPAEPSATFVPTGRVYERHEPFGDIDGRYRLFDRLDLSTTTGNINIEIDPQEGELPADLSLSSNLGSVTVRVSSEYLLRNHRAQRCFRTTVRSWTGSIYAEILLGYGGSALVYTTVGAQTVSVIGQGLGPADEISNLTTLSNSGPQKVVLTSIGPAAIPLSNLRAEHHVLGTGSMDITYPTNWQGEVHANASPVGQIEVDGEGLVYSQGRHQEVRAHRGSSHAPISVEIISEGTGSIAFKC